MLKGRNLISPDDLSVSDIYELMELAQDIVKSLISIPIFAMVNY